jgi:hypothetical protein
MAFMVKNYICVCVGGDNEWLIQYIKIRTANVFIQIFRKPEEKSSLGIHRHEQEENIQMDLKRDGWEDAH